MAKKVLILLLLFTITLCSVIDVNSSENLLQWLCNSSLNDSSLIVFNKASYILNVSTSFCIIQNLTNITLRSMTGHSSIKCTSKSAGFGFVNITNITVTGIDFNGCGTTLTEEAVVLINDTHPHIGYLQKAVLLFNHCHNINISHVTISYYSGYAIMIMNPIGYSTLYGVLVTYGIGSNHKSCLHDDTFSCAGSGIMCVFKDTNVIPKYSKVKVELINATVKLAANIILNIPSFEELGADLCHLPLIGAGGLSLIFKQSYKVILSTHSTIITVCDGTVAGGMLILFTNGMYNSMVIISNNFLFFDNLIPSAKMKQVGGSGITVISILCGTCHAIATNDDNTWKPLSIERSTLEQAGTDNIFVSPNKTNPQYGGGIYLIVLDACGPKVLVIQVNDVYFKFNYAYISGSNIYAFVSKDVQKSRDVDVTLVLKNCEVYYSLKGSSNFAAYTTVPSITLINWKNITIDGGLFHGNNVTVIAAYNSELFFTGNISFHSNRGPKGAALFLQSSYLILQEPLNATFTENKALLYGGAVYIENSIIPREKKKCGMQIQTEKQDLSNLSIYLNFHENAAGLAGKSLYINHLYNCLKMYNKMAINNKEFNWKIIMNFNSENEDTIGMKEVSAEPVNICSCRSADNKIDCQVTHKKFKIVYAYPGMVIQLSLCAIDASGSTVYSSSVATIASSTYKKHKYDGPVAQDEIYLKKDQTLIPLSGTESTVVQYTIYNKVNKYTHAFLSIATPENPPSWSAYINMLPCPLGFILEHDQCICDHFITQTVPDTKCNITSTSISISSGQWFGNVSNTLGFAFLCPPGNCKTNLSHVNVTDPLSMCLYSKEGILCGQCSVELSVVFGTSQCMQCSDLWLLSLIGYGLSGIILVIIMLYLPLTISKGPLAGIIIAMNLTAASTIDFLEGQEWYLYVTRVCVSIVNLSLGFPLCLYNGMTPVVKTGLLFVFPVYLWLLMIVFILFSHYSTHVSNQTAMHSVQVLASLMYLSFSKILMTVIDIIAYIPVHTSHNGTMTVWYGDGSVLYLTGGHLYLFLLSLMFLLFFIIPFILFVTFGGYFLRCSCINKYLRQFLEAFQGPYKQSKGYWFGVRVLVLTYVYLMWGVLRGYNIKLMLFLQLIPVITLHSFQLYLKPFRSRTLNKMDSLCLAIPSFQILVAIFSNNNIISFIIVSLNMLVFVGLITLVVFQVIKKKKAKCCTCFTSNGSQVQVVDDDDEDMDEMRRFLSNLND